LASASQGLYILRVMRERKQCLWEVSRIGGSSTTFIGSVYPVDENQALKAAIAELKNPAGGPMAALGPQSIARTIATIL
jgi:hypothetical protein